MAILVKRTPFYYPHYYFSHGNCPTGAGTEQQNERQFS